MHCVQSHAFLTLL